MTDTRVDFTDVRWTQLAALYLRALDARSAAPILGDDEAVAAMRRIDADFGSLRMRSTAGDRWMVILRARTLDRWAAEFLERHPGATVLHLGCGLDSRAFRLPRPPGTLWFDVDLPDVIALRRRLYADDEGYRMLGCSVTDPSWTDGVPTDGPVLVIAEGLLMYLDPADVAGLLRHVAATFPSGELLFDGMAPSVVRKTRLLPGPWRALRMNWAVRDGVEGHDVARIDSAFRRVAVTPVLSLHGWVPQPAMRWLYRVLDAIPAMRRSVRLFRYTFGR